MVVLYSGTPGSGKSLDCARTIYNWLRLGKPVLCNFPVNTDKIKLRGKKDIRYIPNDKLDPDALVRLAMEHFEGRRKKENSILLVIDEAQLLFNARDWTVGGRNRWTWFFTMHRHFGYFILLCAQFDRMLDRQVRGQIEYEFIHRKVSNIGWRGWFLSLVMMAPGSLFVKVKIWYPMKEKVGSEFYRCHKKYYSLYDTFAILDSPDRTGGAATVSCRVPGAGVIAIPLNRLNPDLSKELETSKVTETSEDPDRLKVTEASEDPDCLKVTASPKDAWYKRFPGIKGILIWITNFINHGGIKNDKEIVNDVSKVEEDPMPPGALPDSDFLSEGEVNHA